MAHLKGTRRKKLKKRFSELFHSNYVRFGVILPLFFLFTVYTAYYYEKGRSIYSIGDSYWYFLFAFITGVVRFSPATFWGRAITLLSSVVRICLYGTILAKISSVFINFQNQRDKGLTKLKNLTKHFLLCGWKPDFEDILEGILFANPEIPPEKNRRKPKKSQDSQKQHSCVQSAKRLCDSRKFQSDFHTWKLHKRNPLKKRKNKWKLQKN